MGDSCLVLDFDGTILDTEEPVFRSWVELWADHGHELSLAQWQSIIGTAGGFDPWTELERRIGRPLDPALQDRRRARRDELQAGHTPRPGVRAWFRDAEALDVPVGIASSSPPDWVEGHLTRLELRAHFACVVCCDGVVPSKPDPTSYRLTCELLGADPVRSVAVEDSPHGVAAAVAAELYALAVPHELTIDLDLSTADLVVESLERVALADVIAEARRRPNSNRDANRPNEIGPGSGPRRKS